MNGIGHGLDNREGNAVGIMTDKTCGGAIKSKTFHGAHTPSLRLDDCYRRSSYRAFFLSASSSPLLLAPDSSKRSRASAEVVPLAEWLPSPEGTPCEIPGAAPVGERRFTAQRVRESCARSSLSIAHTVPFCSTASESGVIWSGHYSLLRFRAEGERMGELSLNERSPDAVPLAP